MTEPKCQSIMNPDQRVSRSELDSEIEQVIAKANMGYTSLEHAIIPLTHGKVAIVDPHRYNALRMFH